mgnify:FL=1
MAQINEGGESRLITLIEDRLESSVKSKSERMEEALTVLLAYCGYSIDKARDYAVSAASTSSQLPRWFEDRVVLNVLNPIARTAASIITANNPTWVVQPTGDTASKRQAARGVQQLLEWFYRTNEISSLMDDVVLRSILTGYAGIYVDWDSVVGNGQYRDQDFGREGWFVMEPVDIFNWHMEPGTGDGSKAHYGIRETTMHIEEARLYYNTNKIQPRKTDSDEDETIKRHLRVVRELDGDSYEPDYEERVRVITYYEKPGYSFPKGYEVTIAGDVVVDSQDHLLLGEFPVYSMNYTNEPHRDYGSGLGTGLLQLQRDMSMTWNGYRARRDQEIMPPWLVPKGSVSRGINTRPRAINEYNARMGAPAQMAFNPLSQVVGSMGDKTLSMMEYVSGINDSSRGEAPTSNATGRLTAFLAELDNRRLGPTVRQATKMLKRVGNRMVRLWQNYGSEMVVISVFGNGRSGEIAEIRKRDLVYSDIDIDVASLMPRTQPLRQETILNLLQMGVIDKQKALDALEFGGFEEAIGVSSTETLNARTENALLDDLSVDVDQVEVLEYEDHQVHIDEHVKHVLLEQPGGAIRSRFDQHIKKHKDAMAATAAAAQGPPQPGGPPAGGPPGLAGGEPIVGGAGVVPGGLPEGMVDLVEPGVDTGAEAELASMAGIE